MLDVRSLHGRLIWSHDHDALTEGPMTRHEFDVHFAPSCSSTQMLFSANELRRINDVVFAAVQNLDAEGWGTKSAVDHAFEAEFSKL